jgi:hypothetical protein
MGEVGIFYGHFVYFTDIWYNLWPFGEFVGYLVYFPRFGKNYREKSGNPGTRRHELYTYNAFHFPIASK